MADMMEFPETFDEFVISYGFIDAKKVYTNGSHLIPVFRVKQWLEHISAKTQMVDKSNFDEEQYKTDLQSAYDCGYNKALSEQESRKEKMEKLYLEESLKEDLENLIKENERLRKVIFENKGEDRPKGHWIERESGTEDKESGFATVIVCSCCDFPATTFYSEDCESRTQIRTKFCPNCGADMRPKPYKPEKGGE